MREPDRPGARPIVGPEVVLRDVEVAGRRVDVRMVGPAVTEVGPTLRPSNGAQVVDGQGGALLPGLHDHHIHLMATAAARGSVRVGPRDVAGRPGLATALADADAALGPGRWLRAVGYHESVAGDLDRWALDALVPRRPVRLQHRSGAQWVLNSAAVHRLALGDEAVEGLERDETGTPTGRLHRLDRWLRGRVPADGPPDLARLGRELARRGVTGVTDTTPSEDVADLGPLAAAVAGGDLPQRVVVTGGLGMVDAPLPPGLERGPVKLVVDDGDYPALDDLAAGVTRAHRAGRAVAVHCVTRTALVLALAAWDQAGSRPGDRVEHGFVVPPELHPALRRHRLTVVVQPGFVAERGDEYLAEVDPDDLPHLHPCRSLIEAGISVAGGTDAPFTDPDPWRAVAAATARTTPDGQALGAHEAVEPSRALALFLGPSAAAGGPPRRVEVGAAADLCLLGHPLDEALSRPAEVDVAVTLCRGAVVPV